MPDVQEEVEALAARLGCAVLVEDAGHRPLWWSTHGDVDAVRTTTILQRQAPPAAAALVVRLGLADATGPVRTPALDELAMSERWCTPVRHGRELLGYVWVQDAAGRVGESDLPALGELADLAGRVLGRTRPSGEERQRRRDGLLARLRAGRDADTAARLTELEDLSPDSVVVVNAPLQTGGWALPDGISVHVNPAPGAAATSGPPLPLERLGDAVARAHQTLQALRAGARLSAPTWAALGSWHLIVDAPPELQPADLHVGATVLLQQPRPDLTVTARALLDHGGDVAAASAELHIHRTTLYYRLDRIEALTGVNLREAGGRDDLNLALRLAAFRAVA
ncbi:PucR family transcriptional regulator [Jatrophihabitans sp. YIM 134969]